MQIVEIATFRVPPRWLFLKMTTDEGIVGWGEPILEGHTGAVEGAINDLKPYLIGQNPDPIAYIWQMLYRARFYRGGGVLMSAMAGIDQALWDIKGKRLGEPVYGLLGGPVRQKMRVYSWIGGDRPSDVGKQATEKLHQGFSAIKMNATEEMNYLDSHAKIDAAVARVAAVREATSADFGIAVDFHGRVHKAMAKVLVKELAPFNLMFVEEPVLPEHPEALAEIARHSSIPIATGERLYSRWEIKALLQAGYVDILQPDVSHAGGISELVKIAAMAEAYDVALAPHCPLGPIALSACLQVDALAQNAIIQEQSLGIHYNEGNDLLDYLEDADVFKVEAGSVKLPTGPGLGISIDEARVREAAQSGHTWRNPVWSLDDGTIAEW